MCVHSNLPVSLLIHYRKRPSPREGLHVSQIPKNGVEGITHHIVYKGDATDEAICPIHRERQRAIGRPSLYLYVLQALQLQRGALEKPEDLLPSRVA
jgi:hypothetical protein